MATAGNVLKLTSIGISNGQAMINVYHFAVTSGTVTATQMATHYRDNMLPFIRAITSASTHYNRIKVQNLQVISETAQLDYDLVGSINGENMPTHDSWSMTYYPVRGDVKAGGKRFGQVIETTQNNGDPAIAQQAMLTALETLLESPATVGSGIVVPVIYGGHRGVLGIFANTLAGVQAIGVTTQNTRKRKKTVGA